jgi:hypothetical protein
VQPAAVASVAAAGEVEENTMEMPLNLRKRKVLTRDDGQRRIRGQIPQ